MSYIFDRHLYKEGMRQTKSIGFTMFALSLVSAIVMPVYYLYAAKKNHDMSVVYISSTGFAGGLRLFAFLIPLFLLAKLFGFLYKRGSSDFYHALPYKRQCIYFTNLLVACTWYVICIIVPLFSATLLFKINAKVRCPWSYLGSNLLVYMVLELFLSGAYLIGASIVGRSKVAFEVGIIVAFLPRVLMFLAVICVNGVVPLIDSNYVSYLSTKYNLAMELSVGAMVDYAGYRSSFTFAPGIIITLIEAVIYIVLGLILFTKRKSEVAENAAPNFKALIIIQVLLVLVIFIFGMANTIVEEDPTIFISAACFGTIVYFISSYISLRKFKETVKTLIGIPLLIALSFVFYFVVTMAGEHVLNDVPDADSIESITILDNNTSFLTGFMGSTKSYSAIALENESFSDPKLSSLVVKNYDYTATLIREKRLETYSSENELIRINYKNGKSAVRCIYIDPDIKETFSDVLETKEKYREIVCSIPTDGEVESFQNKEYNKEIWDCFCKEYEKLSEEKKLIMYYKSADNYGPEYMWGDYSEEEQDDLGEYDTISVRGLYMGQEYRSSYHIYKSFMPETYRLSQKLSFLDNKERFNRINSKFTGRNIENGDLYLEAMPQDFIYKGLMVESIIFNVNIYDEEISYVSFMIRLYENPEEGNNKPDGADSNEGTGDEEGDDGSKIVRTSDIQLDSEEAYEWYNQMIDCFNMEYQENYTGTKSRIFGSCYDGDYSTNFSFDVAIKNDKLTSFIKMAEERNRK